MASASAIFRHVLQGLRLAEYELMLFAAFWFLVGMADEMAIDMAYVWMRLVRGVKTPRLADSAAWRSLKGGAAVFIAAWQEELVIGTTITHLLEAWPQKSLRIYVGCYANDPATMVAAMAAARNDPRFRLVVNGNPGPTTKGDCLNRLYQALCYDEVRSGSRVRMVVIHDAEDMVHKLALPLLDAALEDAEFAQVPVRPEPRRGANWIAGHYIDEFAESHAKAMVVRDAFDAALPAAGVGCAFSRAILEKLAQRHAASGPAGPFGADSLTEDYELGLLVAHNGGRSRFLRVRDGNGALVATRSYFPATLSAAVRQKTRWLHGIAFQGWERLGWWGSPVDIWMALRDRRGPLAALTLAVSYFLLVLIPMLAKAQSSGLVGPRIITPMLSGMVHVCFIGLVWRALMRFAFTAREYGFVEGLRAVLRIPCANVIAVMSAHRALIAYLRSLKGSALVWDKTLHCEHPVIGPDTVFPA